MRAEVRGGLAQVATDVLNQGQVDQKEVAWSVSEVIDTALAEVQEKKAAWTAPDLTRALSNALPDHLGQLDAAQVSQLLDGLTTEALKLAVSLDAGRPGDAALPDELRLADGSSAYQAPGGRLYATPDHLEQERLLASATANRQAPALSVTEANRFIAGCNLRRHQFGRDQLLVSHARAVSKGPAPVPILRGWTAPLSQPTIRRWPPRLRRTSHRASLPRDVPPDATERRRRPVRHANCGAGPNRPPPLSPPCA